MNLAKDCRSQVQSYQCYTFLQHNNFEDLCAKIQCSNARVRASMDVKTARTPSLAHKAGFTILCAIGGVGGVANCHLVLSSRWDIVAEHSFMTFSAARRAELLICSASTQCITKSATLMLWLFLEWVLLQGKAADCKGVHFASRAIHYTYMTDRPEHWVSCSINCQISMFIESFAADNRKLAGSNLSSSIAIQENSMQELWNMYSIYKCRNTIQKTFSGYSARVTFW